MARVKLREDIFVSVCLSGLAQDARTEAALSRTVRILSERFAYWEILAGVDATQTGEFDDLLARWPNLRLIELRPNLSSGRERIAVASEAIGDIIVVTAVQELARVPLLDMIARAEQSGGVVLLQRVAQGMLNPPLRVLGRLAGYRVDLRDLQTMAYDRTTLNRLLTIPDQDIALRFAPLDGSVAISRLGELDMPRQRQILRRQPIGNLLRKIGIAQGLVVSAAPRALSALATLSLLVGAGALIFLIYAVAVVVLRDDVAPGWFTISSLISALTLFLSLAIFGLAAGLRKLLDLALDSRIDDVLGERSRIDLFHRARQELNVEVQDGRAPAEGPSPDGAPQARLDAIR